MWVPMSDDVRAAIDLVFERNPAIGDPAVPRTRRRVGAIKAVEPLARAGPARTSATCSRLWLLMPEVPGGTRQRPARVPESEVRTHRSVSSRSCKEAGRLPRVPSEVATESKHLPVKDVAEGWTRAASSGAISRRTSRLSCRSSASLESCAKPYHKPYQPPPENGEAPQRKPLQGLHFQQSGRPD